MAILSIYSFNENCGASYVNIFHNYAHFVNHFQGIELLAS